MMIMIWFQIGYPLVIFMAALQRVDPEILEAAALDGAGRYQKFSKITVRLIQPEVYVVVLTTTIHALKVFGQIYVLTRGGPGTATIVPSYFAYQNFFEKANVGYGSAISTIMTVIIPVGSLSMVDIVNAQQGGIQNWFLFRNPFTFLAFFIYFIASLAEVNRTPFDIPEAESELVAGFHTEYSGMRFAFFFLAEYANMLLVTCVATTLFLGGWTSLLPGGSQLIPGPILFFLKAFSIIFVQMWLRWSVPRLRVDQLMYLSWKVLLPISFALVLGVGWLAVRG